MIRSDDDERRIPAPGLLQKPNQSANFRVNTADESVVNGLQPSKSLVVVWSLEDSALKLMREPWMLTCLVLRRGPARETRHERGIVHRVVGRGCDPRRMRAEQRQVRDEGAARAADVIDRLVDQKR